MTASIHIGGREFAHARYGLQGNNLEPNNATPIDCKKKVEVVLVI